MPETSQALPPFTLGRFEIDYILGNCDKELSLCVQAWVESVGYTFGENGWELVNHIVYLPHLRMVKLLAAIPTVEESHILRQCGPENKPSPNEFVSIASPAGPFMSEKWITVRILTKSVAKILWQENHNEPNFYSDEIDWSSSTCASRTKSKSRALRKAQVKARRKSRR
jgi:hypothetical protein